MSRNISTAISATSAITSAGVGLATGNPVAIVGGVLGLGQTLASNILADNSKIAIGNGSAMINSSCHSIFYKKPAPGQRINFDYVRYVPFTMLRFEAANKNEILLDVAKHGYVGFVDLSGKNPTSITHTWESDETPHYAAYRRGDNVRIDRSGVLSENADEIERMYADGFTIYSYADFDTKITMTTGFWVDNGVEYE